MRQSIVNAKMYLGLVEETSEFTGGLHGIHRKKKSHIPPFGALGRMIPQDIGLRISKDGQHVESLNSMLNRLGRTLEEHRCICLTEIKNAAKTWHGHENYKGGIINSADY